MSGDQEQLDEANREFELLRSRYSDPFARRIQKSFQVTTVTPGLPFVGPTAYSAPGSVPNQTGPTSASNMFNMGNSGGNSIFLAVMNNLPPSGVSNPGSTPPVGPEEKLRYSCLSGLCIQNPNGAYLGIEACQEAQCVADATDGGYGNGCDCGFGPAHTVFKATILSYTTTAVVAGRNYWNYTWSEVTTGVPRTSTEYGTAINTYEISVDNDGDNVVPVTASLTRRRIPDGTTLPMYIDLDGVPWFFAENPFSVVCA